EQFSEDIQRHLAQRPVLARGDTWVYRFGKFLQHHRIWAIDTIALAAALGTGVVTIQTIALLYLAGRLGILGLWYAATDKTVARRIAQSSLLNSTLAGVILGAITPIFIFIWVPRLPKNYMYIVTAFALANCLIRYAAWLTRNRWSGRLLLNLSPPGRRLTWRNIHPASHHGIFWELSLLFWIVTGPWSRMTMPVQS